MDELDMLFTELDEQELEQLIADIDIPKDAELSLKIKKRLDVDRKSRIGSLPFGYIFTAAALFCVVVTTIVLFAINNSTKPQTVTQQPITVTEAVKPAENPLMVAISTGDDDLISSLLSLPSLISQETLEFALNFANLLSYDTIYEIAVSVKETLGSTGLDSLVESSIFGDSESALKELKRRDSLTMTPFEKLAFFFAVAFCDSEVVDEFVKRGYDVNITDLQGNSIYAIAEKYGNEENMRYAVSKGITS